MSSSSKESCFLQNALLSCDIDPNLSLYEVLQTWLDSVKQLDNFLVDSNLEPFLASRLDFPAIKIYMPELRSQPQFWPKTVSIIRHNKIVSSSNKLEFNEATGFLSVSLISTDSVKTVSESLWTFVLDFGDGTDDMKQFRIESLLCKNGKPCGLLKKYGRILRAPDVVVKSMI